MILEGNKDNRHGNRLIEPELDLADNQVTTFCFYAEFVSGLRYGAVAGSLIQVRFKGHVLVH